MGGQRQTRCPWYRRLGRPQGRSEQVRKILPTTGIRSPGRPARRLVDWYRGYGATTPSHLGRKLAGPLCTAFSSARRPQRRSSSSDMVTRNGNGREVADKFRLKTRLPLNFQGSLTCRKSATWDRQLYFPSDGRRAEDFFARKIRRLRPGLNPRSWVPEASTLTTRPPKPLTSGPYRVAIRTELSRPTKYIKFFFFFFPLLLALQPTLGFSLLSEFLPFP